MFLSSAPTFSLNQQQVNETLDGSVAICMMMKWNRSKKAYLDAAVQLFPSRNTLATKRCNYVECK